KIEACLDRALLRIRGLVDRILELEERDGRPRSITLLRQSEPLLTEREGPVRDLDGAVGVHEVDQRLPDLRLHSQPLRAQLLPRVRRLHTRLRDLRDRK